MFKWVHLKIPVRNTASEVEMIRTAAWGWSEGFHSELQGSSGILGIVHASAWSFFRKPYLAEFTKETENIWESFKILASRFILKINEK